jgi:hypothetical protein
MTTTAATPPAEPTPCRVPNCTGKVGARYTNARFCDRHLTPSKALEAKWVAATSQAELDAIWDEMVRKAGA